MKHYVSYHNADKMGYTYEEATRFSVGTSKSVDRLLHNRIWSVSAEGKPRDYYLRDTWIADEIGLSEQDEFVNYAQGNVGFVFEPPIYLNPLSWFSTFLKSQSNFSLGLQPIREEFVAQLEGLYAARRDGGTTLIFPDEVEPNMDFKEGAVVRVSVNAYERNPSARHACIRHYGTCCFICGFDFGQVYGPEVDGLIHVHHLRPIADVATEYTVDPIEDLRPVCPNCHAVLHSRSQVYSIEEVQGLLKRQRHGQPSAARGLPGRASVQLSAKLGPGSR